MSPVVLTTTVEVWKHGDAQQVGVLEVEIMPRRGETLVVGGTRLTILDIEHVLPLEPTDGKVSEIGLPTIRLWVRSNAKANKTRSNR